MTLDTARMHKDLVKKLNKDKLPQRHLTEKTGIARSTMWRLGQGKEITVSTFLKIVTWLEKDLKFYIIEDDNKKHQI